MMECECEQTVYADYGFYLCNFGSMLSQEEFELLARRASVYLDYYTSNRAKNCAQLQAVKLACCALAEQYKIIEQWKQKAVSAVENSTKESAVVKSETVGSHSVSYQSAAEMAAEAESAIDEAVNKLPQIARQYLAHTGLLYRGGGQCTRRTQ